MQGSAKTISAEEQEAIQKLAGELEYLFSTILVKNEETGIYTVNENELNNSPYTEQQRKDLIEAANYHNSQINNNQKGTMMMAASSTFDRCMKDLLGIKDAVWKEIKGYIDAKQYVAAASALVFVGGISIHPVTIGLFALTCGPKPVK